MVEGAPAVSVVIPTHNRAHLICDALRSVQTQTYSDMEIIVVDDGSDDDTETTVARWAGSASIPLRYIRQARGGGNAARNRGIDAARGRYVAFLDSDDVWRPRKVEKQIALLKALPGYGAVYTGLREVEVESGAVIAAPQHAYPEGDLLRALLVRDATAPTSTYLIEKRLLQEAGCFDLELAARQDWDMWIRIAQRTKIGCVPEALVDLRHHQGPRTASDPTRELRAHRRILEKYAALRRRQGLRVRLSAHAAFHRRAGRVHFHYLDKRWSATGHYILAIAFWPFALDSWAALLGVALPAGLRSRLRRRWNTAFGGTILAIRSH
ncbi:glycosyltransferase family 2 protein [Pikeienuella piscinae]|uniref:Glycosyltransferase family 2 protein n=1 Tax=Pikeienuella piscinae TaxID=2748098 RepID=A0A7L5BUJ2_9RHOB|nr:glycosyltransferase family 2 protein [Pikeienuella piscinae]QIE55940.1 glycosyltransferase family 2 protein [Pikeienuella piscinae]